MIFSRFFSCLQQFLFFSDPNVKLKPPNAIDTVDSGTGAVYYTQQPERETVISMNKTNERTSSNLNKYTNNQDKRITNDTNKNGENDVVDKYRNNCDNFVEKYGASNNDINGNSNGDGDGGSDKMNDSAVSDMYSDNFDDDPYAELQSYLEKVKVSFFYSSFFLFSPPKTQVQERKKNS